MAKKSILLITNPKGDPVPAFLQTFPPTTHGFDADGESAAPFVTVHRIRPDASGNFSFPLAAPTASPGAGGPIRVSVDSATHKWTIPHGGSNSLFIPSSNLNLVHLLVVWHVAMIFSQEVVLSIETSLFVPRE